MKTISSVIVTFALLITTLAPVSAQILPGEARAIVPVVGSTQGAFDANFKTELQLHNPGAGTMTGLLVFRPAGQPGTDDDPSLAYELAPFETQHYDDVVAQMGASGLGSLDIIPDTGSKLPTALFRAFDDKDEAGTTGVTVPMVLVSKALTAGKSAALIVPADLVRFRFNIGVRSLSDGAVLHVKLYNADGSLAEDLGERGYPGNFFEQRPASAFLGVEPQPDQSVLITVVSGRAIVYGTTTDNKTNDGSVQLDEIFNSQPVVEDPEGDGSLLIVAQTTAGEPVTIAAAVSDEDGDTLQYTLGSGPSNGTVGEIIETETGFTIVYTPAEGFLGEDEFTIIIGDGEDAVTLTIRIIVTERGNSLPVADAAAATTPPNLPVEITLTGSDPDDDDLSFAIVTGPVNGTVSAVTAINGTSARVTYKPNAGFSGVDTFEFSVDDGRGGVVRATVTVTVAVGENADPVASDQAVSTSFETPVAFVLAASDADGNPLTYAILTSPAHGALSGTAPNLTYTPNTGFSGTDSFTWRVSDGRGGSDTATVSLEVAAEVNEAPVATSDSVTTDEDTPVSFRLLAADPDGDALSYIIMSSPSSGVLSGTAPNLTYTPNANFNGSDSFTFRVNDGTTNSATATVLITVTPVNDIPVALDDAYEVDEGGVLNIAAPGVLANDTDVESALTATLGTDVVNGALVLNADGSFTYTHDGSETTTDSFTYTASDGTAVSNVATVSITVNPVNDAPVIDLDADDSEGTAGSGFAITFTENDPATLLEDATDAVISDDDHATLASLSVTLSNLLDAGDETLDADVTGTPAIGKSFDTTTPGVGVLTLTGPATIAEFEAVLRTVTYRHTSENPDTTARVITFIANDGTDPSDPAISTVTIVAENDAPVADDATFNVDENSTNGTIVGAVNATDVDGDTLSYAITGGTGATAFAIIPATGEITVADTAQLDFETTPSFTLTVEVTDDGTGNLSDTATITINLNDVNEAPAADDQSMTTDEDLAVVIILTGSDVDGDSLTFAIATGPANGTLSVITQIDATSAQVTYTPSADYNGSDSFTFTSNDGTVDSPAGTVSLTIDPINDAPVADDQSETTDEDVAVVITLTGSDVDGDSLTFAIGTGPANGTLGAITPVDATSAQVTYTPNADFNGADSFTFTVNDGTASSAAATVSITIDPANDAPVADDQATTTDEDVPVVITLTGSDIDGDSLTFAVATGPTSGTVSAITPIDATSAQVTYTPGADFNGADSFTFTANDGTVTSPTATVSLTIDPVNDTPVASAQSVTTDEDVPVVITLTANDVDGDGLSFAIGTGPTSGTLGAITSIDATSAQVTYTPNADFDGSDNFTFTVNDGTVSSTAATISITVDPVNDAPAADAQSVTTDEDVPVVITLTGSDVDGDSLTFAIGTSPANGALSTITPIDATSAQMTYTPNTNFSGADSFTFTVNDGTVSSSAGTVSITINEVNDPPPFTKGADQSADSSTGTEVTVIGWASAMSVGPASESTQTLVGFTAVAANTALFSTQPAIDVSTGTLTFTPVVAASGMTTVAVTLQDDGPGVAPDDNTSAPQTFTITLDAAPTVTSTAPVDAATQQATTTNVVITFSEAVDVVGTWVQMACGTSGTLTPGAGLTISGGPPAFTLDPTADLASGESCTVTIFAANVTDQDTFGDPAADAMAANYVFSFTVDEAPSVSSTSPADNVTDVAKTADIVVNFSENVNVTTSSFAVECPVATPVAFTVTGTGTSTATLNPTADLPGGVTCTVTVVAAQVSDTDAGDPPDHLAANYVFDFGVKPEAVADSYGVTGNVTISVAAGSGILSNDIGPALTIATVNGSPGNVGTEIALPSGALLTVQSDGRVQYVPVANSTTNDSFTYTVANLAGTSDPATVTLNLNDRIIFVNNTLAVAGNGTLATPFNTLAAADALGAPTGGDVIFLYTGSGDYTGGVTLNAGQRLIGQGVALASNLGFTLAPHSAALPGAGVAPSVLNAAGHSVVAGAGSHIAGLTAKSTAASSAAIRIAGVTATVDSVTILPSSSGIGLQLDALGANNFTISNSTISSSSSAAAFSSTGAGSGVVSIGASITSSNGQLVNVTGRSGGSITFNNVINSSGTSHGINVSSNTGGTINFTGASKSLSTGGNTAVTLSTNSGATVNFTGGGLIISRTTGAGIAASVSGTLNITGAGNIINSGSSGAALSVQNVAIGASGLTLQSISQNGGANGIVLVNTGANGLVVTGNSSGNCGGDANPSPAGASPYGARTLPNTGDCTGGTIQNVSGGDGSTAGIGVYLENASNVSLTRMRLTGAHQNYGLRGVGASNVTLDNVLMDGSFGTNVSNDEGTVAFTNLSGSASVTNSFFSGSVEHDFQVRNTSPVTLNRVTVDNVVFGTSTASGDHLLLTNDVAGTLNATVRNSRFMGAGSDMLQFVAQNGGVADLVVQNNVFFNQHASISSGGGGVNFGIGSTASDTASLTYLVTGNRFRGASGVALGVQKGVGTGAATGTITNNLIGDATVANSGSAVGNGMYINVAAQGKHKVLIEGNTVTQYNGFAGMSVIAGGVPATVGTRNGSMHATIRRNSFINAGTNGTNYVDGILFEGGTNGGDAYTVCLNVGQGVGNANTLTGIRNATDGSGITGEEYSVIANNIGVTPADLWFKLLGYPVATHTPTNATTVDNVLGSANGGVSGWIDAPSSSSTYSGNSGSGAPCDLP